MRSERFNSVSRFIPRGLLSGLSQSAFSPLSSYLPPCHPASSMTCSSLGKDLPSERNSPTLTVFFIPSPPSNGVFLTLLGISTTQPQHVVLHQPGHLLPSLASPTRVQGVQDQREILFKLQMKKQGWLPLMSGRGGGIGRPPPGFCCRCNLQL